MQMNFTTKNETHEMMMLGENAGRSGYTEQ